MDQKKLKQEHDQLTKGAGGDFMTQKEIGDKTYIRLVTPNENLNGVYFFKEIIYWINNKPYVSYESFGEECPLKLETDEARKSDDPEIRAMIKDRDNFSVKPSYNMVVLECACKFKAGALKKFKVLNKRVLQAGKMLVTAINAIVIDEQYQNGTEDGIADRKKGFCMTLERIDKGGINVDYNATGFKMPNEVDKKWYKDNPDLVQMSREKLFSKKDLTKIIRNYFYDEPLPKSMAKDGKKKKKKISKEVKDN